ncbi:MAG: OmpA family protein, partial [Burkholderiales bacterium]
TGRAEVTSDGLDAIAKALEVMRNNPKAILLLKAYTDTRASDTLNRSLARRRADAVRQRLIAQGASLATAFLWPSLQRPTCQN